MHHSLHAMFDLIHRFSFSVEFLYADQVKCVDSQC